MQLSISLYKQNTKRTQYGEEPEVGQGPEVVLDPEVG